MAGRHFYLIEAAIAAYPNHLSILSDIHFNSIWGNNYCCKAEGAGLARSFAGLSAEGDERVKVTP
jgi:hypothetical protein